MDLEDRRGGRTKILLISGIIAKVKDVLDVYRLTEKDFEEFL